MKRFDPKPKTKKDSSPVYTRLSAARQKQLSFWAKEKGTSSSEMIRQMVYYCLDMMEGNP